MYIHYAILYMNWVFKRVSALQLLYTDIGNLSNFKYYNWIILQKYPHNQYLFVSQPPESLCLSSLCYQHIFTYYARFCNALIFDDWQIWATCLLQILQQDWHSDTLKVLRAYSKCSSRYQGPLNVGSRWQAFSVPNYQLKKKKKDGKIWISLWGLWPNYVSALSLD